ncbi:putative two-component response regulator [Candidatus Protochlamydia naegleriophila]|uniref:Putative two-component response regulator n=1 Tax=Candidatus Protochlamydia naegleriophila TaxID=389348 RepID=A0A0U5EQC3_9BACT|nr:response regulator [Candidatus Protochlamydia naegleriophila]CUI16352.1 putative two-component response regulator [Candidatus Protochlamydia naegleriophila]
MNEPKEVLIVEDNEDNSLLAEKILNYYGFKTVVMAHGHSALEYCESHRPDLILMDLSLPDMDGMELTRLLRKKTNYQTVPIIALTAHAMRGIQEYSQEAGLNEFLTKPFLPNDLIDLVRKYLQ